MTLSEYYDKHPGTEEIANKMLADAQKEFGPESEVFIKFYADSEVDDQYPLIIVRLPDYSTPGLMDRIDAIWERYYMSGEGITNLTGWVQLNTDFRKPREP